MRRVVVILLFFFIFINVACATKKFTEFYSTKSSKVNMRTGPGYNYPVKFVYLKSHLPMKFIEEFDGWVKLSDVNHDYGWINKNVLSSKRYAITTKLTAGYNKSSEESDISITIDPMVILELKKCTLEWCFVKLFTHKIWVKKSAIWGVVDNEIGDM